MKRVLNHISSFKTNVSLFGWKKALKMAQRGYLHQHYDTYLSPLDLMVPLDGKVTIGQLIIVSRMLDIERIRNGEDSYWEMHLARYHRNKIFSDDEIKERQAYFKSLVQTLDQKGWDFNVRVVTINEEPLFSYDGTHKLAYAILEKPQQVLPCTSRCYGWSMCKQDGVEYLKERGVDDNEISALLGRYNKLMADVDFSKYIIIRKSDYNELKIAQLAKELDIEIIKNNELAGQVADAGKILHNKQLSKVINDPCRVLKILIKKDTLAVQVGEKRICSEKIDQLMKNAKIKMFYYTPTITEANELRIVWGGQDFL